MKNNTFNKIEIAKEMAAFMSKYNPTMGAINEGLKAQLNFDILMDGIIKTFDLFGGLKPCDDEGTLVDGRGETYAFTRNCEYLAYCDSEVLESYGTDHLLVYDDYNDYLWVIDKGQEKYPLPIYTHVSDNFMCSLFE